MKECPNCQLCYEDEAVHCPYDGGMLFVSNPCRITLEGRYTLERRLGKGGMGSVYRAKHVHLKSTHAIKIISPELVKADQSLLVRFTQEAVVVASIHHPNVILVTDFGIENSETPYLVMEYIEGISLDDFLRDEKHLSPARAFEIFKPIALGVGAAHSKGITHRDLKPLNIMLRKGVPIAQAVKVLDFGLAKIKSTESFSSLVQAKTANVLGSPHYMPPEQWDNENVDERSDIYSLGVILFQMLTGDVPFKGGSLPNIMFQHLQAPVPPFESFGISVSSQIESVIQKALAKSQTDRFATIEEFLFAYEKALSSTNDRIAFGPDAKTVSFEEEFFSRYVPSTQGWEGRGESGGRELPYLDSEQNKTIATWFNQPRQTGGGRDENLEREFIDAQTRVEHERTKVSLADKLAEEFSAAQRAAEEARRKFIEAKKQLEDDIRQQMQAEMEEKLAAERQAREHAEAEARRLAEEAAARRQAEERANQLAKAALEAQHLADAERRKAEQEAQQRQMEEGTRRKAESEAARLAREAAEARQRYEEAVRAAEAEARSRREAEIKRQKVEEEIRRIAAYEAERRSAAEAEAAQQIKEQASRLEQQAIEAQKKADEARQLAEAEAKKREMAEAAQRKAEEEARRLAEEMVRAQQRIEEAEQRARSEAELRAQEEEARKKAEESARSSSLENQQNLESVRRDLMSRVAEAQLLAKTEAEKRAVEEAARIRAEELARSARQSDPTRDSSPTVTSGTDPEIDILAENTSSTTGPAYGARTEIIPVRRTKRRPALMLGGLLAMLVIGTGTVFLTLYGFAPDEPEIVSHANERNTANGAEREEPMLPERIRTKMVAIEGGEFRMGRDDANTSDDRIYASQYPAHAVSVGDFYLDTTEVTNEEYAEFVMAVGYDPPPHWRGGGPPAGQGRMPVTNVSYFDARNFADWISARDRVPCRLPTEEEWEYAARSGDRAYRFPWGNEWAPERVNFATGTIREAGSTPDETETWKVKEMMGNVLEWTSSTLEYYPGFPENRKEPISGKITVRGVSFTREGLDGLGKTDLLLTLRQGVSPERKFEFLGFRLMCDAE